MLYSQRILFSDDGTLSDWSLSLNDYAASSQAVSYVAGEDYIYIGTDWPFNHKFFEVETANADAAIPKVEVWDGGNWNQAVDYLDGTAAAGVPLAQSGVLRFTPNRNKAWARESDSFDVTGLESTESSKEIYNMYWVRLSFDADVTVTLKHVGQKFASEAKLVEYYPDLNNSTLKAAFASGKTTWDDQLFAASQSLVNDLRKRNIIKYDGQVIDYESFELATVDKAAELIYFSLGEPYAEQRKVSQERYKADMDMSFYRVDVSGDALLSESEKSLRVGYLKR